jgi:GPH family glycoside/pentoside/hexuronide:cation symporter
MMSNGERLGLKVKIGYGAGDMVAGLAFNTLSFFYLYFLNTVIGLPAYLAGLALLIGRVWDGVIDPVMGMVVDSTTARQGKHRFWLILSIVPFAFTFILLWVRFPGGQTAQFLIYTVLLVLFSTAFTMYNIPYGSMTADLTQDYHERTALTGVRMVFSLLAMIVGAGATQLLAGRAGGYPGMAMIYGVVMVAAGVCAFKATEGRDSVAQEPEGVHLRIWLQAFKNRPFVILVTAYLLMTLATTGVSGIFVYFVKYNLKLADEFQSSLIMGVLVVAAIAALPLWAWASKAIGKKAALFAGMAVFAVGLMIVTRIGLTLGTAVFYGLIIFTGAGLSAFFIVLWSMIPDVVEYGQMQTGHRHEGVYYGLWFFIQKLGMAASAALNGAILSATGFRQTGGGPFLEQSASALTGITTLLSMIPLGFTLAGLAVLAFYPINAHVHAEIRRKLAQGGGGRVPGHRGAGA